MGITQAILATALEVAEKDNATRINEIDVSVGDLTDVVEDALQFAFEVVRQGTIAENATLVVNHVHPRSVCRQCGEEFEHDKYDLLCPKCESFLCEILAGRELQIDSIDIDTD